MNGRTSRAAPGVAMTAGNALAEMAQRALRTFEVDVLLRDVVSAVCAMLAADSCAVFERLGDDEELVLRANAVRLEGSSAMETVHPSQPQPPPATARLGRLAAGGPDVFHLPIPGEPPFGILAVRLGGGRAATGEEVAILGRVAGILSDGIERIRAEERHRHQALHDSLTGLPNRQLAMDRLEFALAGMSRSGSPVAVFYLDLDQFKVVNDRLGHSAGDRVLTEVGARLSAAVRPTDTLARVGGDEFLLICSDVDAEKAAAVARRLTDALVRPVRIDSVALPVAASTGIALAEPGLAADALLARADSAMYRAKRAGGDRWEIFDASVPEEPRAPAAPVVVPLAPDNISGLLAGALASDDALEALARPLLDVLVELGRFDCGFLALGEPDGELEIRLARSAGGLALGEGQRLPSAGFGRLISAPLRKPGGRVFGVLGAADAEPGPVDPPLAAMLEVCAGLLSAALALAGSQEHLDIFPARSRESTASVLRLWASFTALLLDPEHGAPVRLDGGTMGFALGTLRALLRLETAEATTHS